jgi:exodeoxyribonuclease X
MTDWTSLRCTVVDVEGNGQHPPDLVELAVVPIVGGVIGEPSSWLVRPDTPITPFARRLHGITNQAVADAPSLAAVQEEVRAALTSDAVIAHNAHVDIGLLEQRLGGWRPPEVFDTLKLARRLLPNQGSYRLGSLVDALKLAAGLPEGLTPHRATYDALVTARLFLRLVTTENGRALTLEDLREQPSGRASDEAATLF